jgi:hypothetical protein
VTLSLPITTTNKNQKAMQSIKFKMTGICPLMLNNPQTVNPMNEYSKALKELTSKRSKTDDDQNEIFHLKFLASCYYSNRGEYIIPANMIAKSFEAGAKENKLGAKFQRSLFVFNDGVLNFPENGCSPEELWQNHSEKYVDIRPVGIMKSKVVTARLIIPEWSMEGELFFDETQLNKSEIWLALKNAGSRYGIGTYRQCYGRYNIEEIKDKK